MVLFFLYLHLFPAHSSALVPTEDHCCIQFGQNDILKLKLREVKLRLDFKDTRAQLNCPKGRILPKIGSTF